MSTEKSALFSAFRKRLSQEKAERLILIQRFAAADTQSRC